ncbi:DUF4380 domain-containing protein [Massilia rhizosphaerae]|uniref:DUF4380 domain-containing protein n=1 Tax=Massilia rhizosphaerae TaxID=2784389 RepID=UPI0018DD4AB2|nr:DUF4380 domain-containing protein [Massilia rhizosphaerae]
MPTPRKTVLALALPCALMAAAHAADIPVHTLANGSVHATVTDAIGGRLLSFALAGRSNFLKVDTAAGDPGAPIGATTDNVGYLGHEIWIGPQKEWWSHQDVNPGRAGASWPPDPWLSLARYKIEDAHPDAVTLASPASPVNGLQLVKRYSLVAGKPHSLRLDVDAANTRKNQVAWDIWFNTRAHADTRVYVPVARRDDVRQQAIEPKPDMVPLTWTLADGLFSLDAYPAGKGRPHRNGKMLLQPSAGWMAGFHGGQVLVIQFAHQPRAAIHPDQGQVELYNDWQPDAPDQGLMEMEVHAPYVKLAPGRHMQASEQWTLLSYDGPDTRQAQVAFLRAHARELGLVGI